nr:copia protein [Tanacetum cinerariifolium]
YHYTSTVKSSKEKNGDEKLNEDTDSKTNKEPLDQEDQAFLKKLKRLNRQEKEANDVAKTLRKTFGQSAKDLLLQAGAARASNTNYNPILEDIYDVLRDGIFTSASYNDEGAMADFTNLETTVNVYRNKKDERGVVVKNKTRLVAQGHRQEERIDYDEVFAPVARIEAIRIFLAFASFIGFIVYQMDVKSTFFHGKIDKEVYVSQPSGFINPKFPNKVYKVVKSLYGLHQDPRACVKTASSPIETKKPLVKDEKAVDVDVHLYRSMISFRSLQRLHILKLQRGSLRISKANQKLGLWYPRELDFDLEAYSNSDYAGANLDRKSIIGGCQFLGRRLVLWQCKKKTIITISITEAEHHFIRDAYEKKLIQVLKIHTNDNVADLLTKAFDNMLDLKSSCWYEGQTTTGKELSNPLMAGSLPKTTLSTKLLKVNVARLKLTTARVYVAEGTRFFGEVTLLFDNMLVHAPKEVCILQADVQLIPITTEPSTSKPQKKHKPKRKHTQESEVLLTESPAKQTLPSPSNDPLPHDIDVDVEINLEKAQEKAYNLDLDHQEKVLSMMDVNEEEHADVEEVLEVVKAAKLMTEVVTTAGATKVSVPRKRRGVIIQDPKETTTTTATMQPKNAVIEQVKRNERLNDVVMKYQTLKRKPLTQAQARRNMIVYLKNIAGFKMDYFKGMTYNEIKHPFKKHYTFNQTFLDELNKGVKVLETEVSSKREGESLKQEIAKKQKMEEETEERKKHLQIVTDDDDDMYKDATPLASNIPIVDYKIHT